MTDSGIENLIAQHARLREGGLNLVVSENCLSPRVRSALASDLAGRYQDDAPYWGMQKAEVWQRYTDWLFENGFISERIDVEKAFTNDFTKK